MSLPAHNSGEHASSTEFLKEYGKLIIDASSLIEKLGTVIPPTSESRTFNLERILGLIERVFDTKLLPEDVYYITGLPTDMQTGDVVVITLVALLMSFLATLYPAWRAARTQPAEALRYE